MYGAVGRLILTQNIMANYIMLNNVKINKHRKLLCFELKYNIDRFY